MKWTAREIGRAIFWNVFNGRHVVVVPDCQWTGAECDMLVVRNDLRLVDIEIKISRGDLKADAHKDKWFDMPNTWQSGSRPKTPRSHPAKIWKHYYCLPSEIWDDSLLASIQPASGILLIRSRDTYPIVTIKRQAKPNREAKAIDAEDVCDIARLSQVRMWKAYDEIDSFHREREQPKHVTVSAEHG